MHSDPSLLDIELLDESAEDGVEGLCELIDMYLVQADETIAGLQTAVGRGEAGQVADLAHKLAGSSAVCGFNGMTDLLRTIERQGRENRLEEADAVLAKIMECLDLSRQLLDEYLTTKKSPRP